MFKFDCKVIFWLLFIFTRQASPSKIKVEITHSKYSNYDELLFYSQDTSICTKFNANFVRNNAGTIKCSCGINQMFIGINGNQPKCQDENYGNLYGCGCKSGVCSDKLKTDYNKELAKWKFFNLVCHYSTGKFRVNFWDGQTFVSQPLTQDFTVTSDTETSISDTIVSLKWKDRPSYEPYKGRLIKFELLCGGSTSVTRCFMLKGIGTYSIFVDDLSSSSTSKSSSNGIMAGVIIGVIAIVVIIVVGILCQRRGCCKSEDNGTQRPPQNQQGVSQQQQQGRQQVQQQQVHVNPAAIHHPKPEYEIPPPYYLHETNYQHLVHPPPAHNPPPLPGGHPLLHQAPQPFVTNTHQIITMPVTSSAPPIQVTSMNPAVPTLPAQRQQRQGPSISGGLRIAGNVARAMNDLSDISEAAGGISELFS